MVLGLFYMHSIRVDNSTLFLAGLVIALGVGSDLKSFVVLISGILIGVYTSVYLSGYKSIYMTVFYSGLLPMIALVLRMLSSIFLEYITFDKFNEIGNLNEINSELFDLFSRSLVTGDGTFFSLDRKSFTKPSFKNSDSFADFSNSIEGYVRSLESPEIKTVNKQPSSGDYIKISDAAHLFMVNLVVKKN